jgi:hypothetical protein
LQQAGISLDSKTRLKGFLRGKSSCHGDRFYFRYEYPFQNGPLVSPLGHPHRLLLTNGGRLGSPLGVDMNLSGFLETATLEVSPGVQEEN